MPFRSEKKLPFFREVAGSSAISAGCSLSSPLSSAVSRAEELITRSSVSGATRHVDRFPDRDKRLSLGRVARRRSGKCATSFGRAGGTTGKQVGNTKEWLGTRPLAPLPLDVQATKTRPQNCSNHFRFKLTIIENTKY